MSSSQAPRPTAPKRVRVIISKPDDYLQIPANGIFGGLTPRGDLICHFFLEYYELPKEEAFPVVDGRPVAEETKRTFQPPIGEGELLIKRDMKAAIILPIQQVPSIISWFEEKLKESGVVTVEKEAKSKQ